MSAAVLLGSAPFSVALLLVVGVVGSLYANNLYKSRLTLSVADDLPPILAGIGAVTAVTGVVAVDAGWVSLARMVLLAGIELTAVLSVRVITYGLVKAARRRGWVSHRTLILGTGPTARRVAHTLERHPEHGLRVVGFIGPHLSMPDAVSDGILSHDPSQMTEVVDSHDVDVVVAAHVGDGTTGVLRALRSRNPRARYTLYLVPPLFQMLHASRGERIRDIALIKLRPNLSAVLAWRSKRTIDVAFAALALALLSPLLLVIAIAVYVEMRGSILFKQTRVGRYGRQFTLYKFRSLRPADPDEAATHWSVSGDDRLGPVGRFLRRSSLDELPQLFNILRGDMSLVGPRPERPYFVDKFTDEHDAYLMRHRVRPGLTGWAAVHGLRGDTSIQERAYFDNVYIDNWSLWFDIKIIARTFAAVVHG